MDTYAGYKPKVCSRLFYAFLAHFTGFLVGWRVWFDAHLPRAGLNAPADLYRGFSPCPLSSPHPPIKMSYKSFLQLFWTAYAPEKTLICYYFTLQPIL